MNFEIREGSLLFFGLFGGERECVCVHIYNNNPAILALGARSHVGLTGGVTTREYKLLSAAGLMPPPRPAYGLPQGNAAQGELSWAGRMGLKAGDISQVLPDCRPLVWVLPNTLSIKSGVMYMGLMPR